MKKKTTDECYFAHDANTHRKPEFLALRKSLGQAAYGSYWTLVERMRLERNYQLPYSGKFVWVTYAEELLCSPEEAKAFVDTCIHEFEVFGTDGEFFWSPLLLEKMGIKDAIREQCRAAARARWEKEHPQSERTAPAEQTEGDRNADAPPTDSVSTADAIPAHSDSTAPAEHPHPETPKSPDATALQLLCERTPNAERPDADALPAQCESENRNAKKERKKERKKEIKLSLAAFRFLKVREGELDEILDRYAASDLAEADFLEACRRVEEWLEKGKTELARRARGWKSHKETLEDWPLNDILAEREAGAHLTGKPKSIRLVKVVENKKELTDTQAWFVVEKMLPRATEENFREFLQNRPRISQAVEAIGFTRLKTGMPSPAAARSEFLSVYQATRSA